jgi:hypothetical protein
MSDESGVLRNVERIVNGLAVAVLVLAAAGCGSTIRAASTEVPRNATPVFADAALGVLETQQTRQRIDTVLGTPEMQHAIGEFGAGIARGVEEKVSAKDFQPLARTVGATATDAALQTAATDIPRTIGPAVQTVLADGISQGMRDATQRDLGPGLAAMMSTPEFKQALGEASRQVGREAVIGSNDALTEIAGQKTKAHSGIVGMVGMLIESRWTVAMLAGLILLVLPFAWLLRDRATARRYRVLAERRAIELGALVHALEALGERPLTADVVALLKEQLQGEPQPHSPMPGRRASSNRLSHA